MDWRVAALACCLVVAGCNGLAGPTDSDGQGEGTLTPAPVPTDTASGEDDRGTPAPATLPPGVSPAGIENVSRLARAHRATLEGRSYVWLETENTARTTSGSVGRWSRRVNRTVVGAGGYRHDSDRRLDWPGTGLLDWINRSTYVEGAVGFRRLRTAEGSSYARVSAGSGDRFRLAASASIERFVPDGPATVVPVERDGRRLVRVEIRPGPETQLPGTRNYSATLLVTPEGFVRSLEVHFATSGDRTLEWISYEFRYTRVGNASVRRPAWIAAARSNTTAG